jgi:alanyl-tRNA synthetase
MNGSTEQPVAVVLEETPFYVESGGQVSDTGVISGPSFEIIVTDMKKFQDYYIHEGYIEKGSAAELEKYAKDQGAVTASVDGDRRWDIMRNHTVTHLTHAALRKVLGEHIKQSGSYVGPEHMRFDFSHHQPMTPEEIREVERIVNEEILKDTPVVTDIMDLEDARKTGAMALFGEKYEDKVRVVSVAGFSKELCGGTHVSRIGQIGPFFITLETGIASGVRRLEAITGRGGVNYMLDTKQFRRETAAIVGRPEPEALAGVEQLREQNSSLQKELKKVKAEMFSGGGKSVGEEQAVGKIFLVTNDFGDTDRDIMAGWLDGLKEQNRPLVALALGRVDGKYTFMAAASHTAFKEFKIDTGKLAKALLPKFGGRGGGKPTFAQGSVADETSAESLFGEARTLLSTNGR